MRLVSRQKRACGLRRARARSARRPGSRRPSPRRRARSHELVAVHHRHAAMSLTMRWGLTPSYSLSASSPDDSAVTVAADLRGRGAAAHAHPPRRRRRRRARRRDWAAQDLAGATHRQAVPLPARRRRAGTAAIRELDEEARAAPRRAAGADRSAMQLDQLFRDRQAQAEPPKLRVVEASLWEKRSKTRGRKVSGMRAVSLTLSTVLAPALRRPRPSAFRGELDRIAEQVPDDLLKTVAVAGHERLSGSRRPRGGCPWPSRRARRIR